MSEAGFTGDYPSVSFGESFQEDAFEEDETVPRPFVKWAGGKRQLLSELRARVPEEFQTYFEPFLGGGALFFAVQPERAVLSETNSELINAYLVVKNHVYELLEDLSRHVHSEDYFYQIRGIDREDDYVSWTPVRRASRLIYLNKTCYNGLYRVNSKGHFNAPFGDYTNPKIADRDNLLACSRALSTARVLEQSFDCVVEQAVSGDFVYFDPPYVPRSSTASFTAYTEQGFGTDMQERLRDVCRLLDRQGVRFMLTNSSTDLVCELYQGFHIESVEAARSINSKADKRGRIAELIVRNYE